MNRTASALLAAAVCALALLVAPISAQAGDEPPLVDNAQAGSPAACPARSGPPLELRRVSDVDRSVGPAATAVDANGDGLVCVDVAGLVNLWPAYTDDTIVTSSWWPSYIKCQSGYWLLFLGPYDHTDPLEAFDHNHDRWTDTPTSPQPDQRGPRKRASPGAR